MYLSEIVLGLFVAPGTDCDGRSNEDGGEEDVGGGTVGFDDRRPSLCLLL